MKQMHVRTLGQWRDWLAQHHASESEVWLVFYKRHTGVESIAYEDARDEALMTTNRRLLDVRLDPGSGEALQLLRPEPRVEVLNSGVENFNVRLPVQRRTPHAARHDKSFRARGLTAPRRNELELARGLLP